MTENQTGDQREPAPPICSPGKHDVVLMDIGFMGNKLVMCKVCKLQAEVSARDLYDAGYQTQQQILRRAFDGAERDWYITELES